MYMQAAAQHFIGLSEGYSLNNMSSSIREDFRMVASWKNVGLLYKYYGGKWVGIQAGVNYAEKGYQRDSTAIRRYQTVEIPFVTQFHYEFWKLRAVANAGLYGAYLLSAEDTYLQSDIPERVGTKENYTFQSTDYRIDYGLRLGAGLGVVLHPVEIQFEFNYALGLAYVRKPLISGETTIFNRFSQMIVSVGVLIAL